MVLAYLEVNRDLLNIDQSSNNECLDINFNWPISIASIDYFLSHEKLKPVTILKLGEFNFFEFLLFFCYEFYQIIEK